MPAIYKKAITLVELRILAQLMLGPNWVSRMASNLEVQSGILRPAVNVMVKEGLVLEMREDGVRGNYRRTRRVLTITEAGKEKYYAAREGLRKEFYL